MDIQIFHLGMHSMLTQETLRSLLPKPHNQSIVFVEDPEDTQVRNKPMFIIYDWLELLLQMKPSTSNNQIFTEPPPNAQYIVINMRRDDHGLLTTFPWLNSIRGLFYQQDTQHTMNRGFAAILQGEIWVPREALLSWMQNGSRRDKTTSLNGLSDREASVLNLIGAGLSNKEISEQLYISTNTVKAHLYNIYKKIEVNNRLQAALWASENLGGCS